MIPALYASGLALLAFALTRHDAEAACVAFALLAGSVVAGVVTEPSAGSARRRVGVDGREEGEEN